MAFLKELALRNGFDINSCERRIALIIFEKLKWELIDFKHPVHVLRNKADHKNTDKIMAICLLEKKIHEVFEGLKISVFKKLVGDDPW